MAGAAWNAIQRHLIEKRLDKAVVKRLLGWSDARRGRWALVAIYKYNAEDTAKRLRDAAERHARDNGNSTVSPEHVASVAARLGNAA